MSVLKNDRDLSPLEFLQHAVKLQGMLKEFAQRNFGLRDTSEFIKKKYRYEKDDLTEYDANYYLLTSSKRNIDSLVKLMLANLRRANSIYPQNLHELQKRKDFQDLAIGNCEAIIGALQEVVETFEVDVNRYKQYIEAIDREIWLIKRWRRSDNKLRNRLKRNEEGNI